MAHLGKFNSLINEAGSHCTKKLSVCHLPSQSAPSPNLSLSPLHKSLLSSSLLMFPQLHPQAHQMELTIFKLLLLLQIIKTCLCSIDQQYLDCEPQTCGNGQNISYPFWILNQQKSHCGFPGFDLSCNTNNQPVLNLHGYNYTVQNIYYHNQSLRITDAVFSNTSSTCSVPIWNLTLYGDRFKFARNYTDMFFFSNCSPSSDLKKYEMDGCTSITTTIGLAILEQDLKVVNAAAGNCSDVVKVPVELYGDEGDGDNGIGQEEDWWEYYEKVLRRGFVLNYRASDCARCEKSGGRCGFDFDPDKYRFMCFCSDRPHLSSCKSNNKNLPLKIGLGIGGSLILIICSVCFILWCRFKRRHASELLARNISSDSNSKSYLERGSVYFGVPIFPYSELEEATNHFDSNKELGDGGFGTVYHGILRDGREVAVKRLYESNYKRVEQFMNEIEILTRLRHKNLVTLYGCTSRHSRELLLVYEYIPNGTVADHLHGDRTSPGSVTWPIRMSIAIETASALAYLHASDIIHRDVKTNNILLDNNFCVKVADFGLSRLFPMDVTHVSTAPQGTPGYVDPEYHQCYQLTNKSDVYSFGVVLVELISSLPAVDISRHRHEINLSNLAINKIQNRAYNELIDPYLGFESDSTIKNMITAVAELAFQCLQNDKEMRPSMDEVLETLKAIESGTRYHEAELIGEEGDHVGVLNSSVIPPPSPESDEVVLLSKMRPPFSPISVTEKWVSTATTPSTSA